MKNPNRQTRIRNFWLEGFRPAMVFVASLLVLGIAVPLASAAPKQAYKFMTVDAPGQDLSNNFQLTWINDDGLVIQQYVGLDGHNHTAALLEIGMDPHRCARSRQHGRGRIQFAGTGRAELLGR